MMNSFFFSVLLSLLTFSQTSTNDRIASYLNAGNADGVARYFASSIELSTPGKEGVYSKTQATIILRDFLSVQKVKSFKILHQGTNKTGMTFIIGTLTCAQKNYRVTVNLKGSGDAARIQQLKFSTQR